MTENGSSWKQEGDGFEGQEIIKSHLSIRGQSDRDENEEVWQTHEIDCDCYRIPYDSIFLGYYLFASGAHFGYLGRIMGKIKGYQAWWGGVQLQVRDYTQRETHILTQELQYKSDENNEEADNTTVD